MRAPHWHATTQGAFREASGDVVHRVRPPPAQAGEAIQRGPTIAQPTSPRKQFSMLKNLRRDISMHHFIEPRAFRK
jgi:hypothetical protein